MQTRKTLLLCILLSISLSMLFICAPDAPDFDSIKVPKIDAAGKIFLPQDSTLFLGEKYYLYIKMKSGASPLNYQWKKDGITIDSSSGDTLKLTLSKESVGAYRVFVSNSYGIDSSALYTIKDTALYSAKLLNGGNIGRIGTPAQDSNLTFFVRGRGADTVKFQWYKGDSSYHTDSLLTGKTDSILRFTPVKYTDNGYYYVVCRNRYGSQTSLVDSILIVDTIKPSIQLTQPTNNSIISDSLVLVKAVIKDKNGIRVAVIEGDTVFSTDSIYTKLVKLSIGNNSFSIKAIDKSKASNCDSLTVALTYDPAAEDILPPFIELLSPANNSVLADSLIQVKVKVKDKSGISAVLIKKDTVTSTDSIYTKKVILKKGVNTFSIIASDGSKKKNADSVAVTLIFDPNAEDNLPPIIELVAPVNNSFVVDSVVKIRVKVFDISGIGLVTIKNEAATLADGLYEKEVTLKKGPNKFFVKAIDNSLKKNRDSLLISLTFDPTANDTTRPIIKLLSPSNNSTVSDSIVQVKAIVTDANGLSLVTINGDTATSTDSVYSKTIKLSLGANSVLIKAIDNSLKKNRDSLKITLTYDPTAEDNTPPIIEVLSPVNNSTTVDSMVQVKARIWDKSGISSVTINGVVVFSSDSIYAKQIKLSKGVNSFFIKAIDRSTKKNADSVRITITYDPTANDTLPPYIRLLSPPNGSTVSDSLVQVKAIITDASGLSLVTINEQTANSSDSIYIKQVRLVKGSNTFFIKAVDNSTKKNRDSLKIILTYDPTMEDNTPPIIEVLYPPTNTTTSDSVIQTRAKIWDRSGLSSVTINAAPVTSSDSIYIKQVKLSKGSNTFFVKAVDNSTKKNADSVRVTVTYAPTYRVTYNGNGSTGGSVPVDTNRYIAGATVTVLGNTGLLVKAGYSFVIWNGAADGTGKNYSPGSVFLMDTTNMILYAKWSANLDTITFNPNGGTGTMAPQILATGATAKLTANAFTRTGYVFAGWALTADGAVAYADTASFSMGTTNVTLYAVWTAVYTVTYNGNGNTGGTVPATQSYVTGSTVTVAAQGDLVKTGCFFMGWNTAANGSGTNYTAGTGTFTMGSAAITLYANWADVVDIDGNGYHAITIGTQTWLVENLKTIKFNDGTSIPLVVDDSWGNLTTPGYCWYNNDSTAYKGTYGALYNWYTVNTGKLAPTGWHVPTDEEWSTLTTYLGGESIAGGKLKEAGLAHWITPNTGATNETGFSALPGGYRFPSGIIFSNIGYNGVWWSSTEYTVSSSWNRTMSYNNAEVVREANNKEGGKSVRCVKGNLMIFDSQGATVPANPAFKVVIPPATTVDALPTPPTKTGYTFSGWFTAINGGGTEFTASTAVTSNITVYAKWISLHTVTYNGNGSTGGTVPATQSYAAGDTVTVAANTGTLDKTGCTFSGWNTATNGLGTNYAPGDKFIMGATDVILYANWIVIDIDGNVYHTVTIGTQTWMVENLKTTKFNDRTAIPLVTDNTAWYNLTTPGYCWYNNDETNNKNTYGALYNWLTVNTSKLAPSGWHVATDTEWTVLTTYLGGEGVAGGKLKEAGLAHWQSPNAGATNETGFTALPGGYRDHNGPYYSIGNNGLWWSSGDNVAFCSWGRSMRSGGYEVYRGNYAREWGLSVRCIMGHAVTFDNQSAIVAAYPPNKIVIPPATTIDALPTPPTKTDYVFGGWFTQPNGGGIEFTASTVVTASITVYAKWIPLYTVTYNGNGNTGGTVPATGSYKTGETVTVAANTGNLVKTGYIFAGWNTAADGTGTIYLPGSVFTIGTSNVLLYAIWADVVDADGNGYHIVTIGSQTWMVENLKTTRYNDNTAIPLVTDNTAWNSLTTPGYCWYNNDEATFKNTYGALYNWYTANVEKLAPAGWHVPTEEEWTTLTTYLGGESVAGGKLKESGTAHWASPNSGATNETGFTALPGGYRPNNSTFTNMGSFGYWWSTTADDTTSSLSRYMGFHYANVYNGSFNKQYGFNVRCIQGNAVIFNSQSATTPASPSSKIVIPPTTTIDALPTPPTKTGCVFDGWYTEPIGIGTPFTASTPVTGNITVYAKWVVRDADGNVYNTVTIGTQTWTVENLRTTKYNDNTAIPAGPLPASTSFTNAEWAALTTPGYCWYNDDIANKATYGALYNWYTVNTGKLAPPGWHVPTDAEWDILQNYLIANGYNWDLSITGNKIAKSMAAKTNWNTSTNPGGIGNDLTTNNKSGFSALPGGARPDDGYFCLQSTSGYWWSATECDWYTGVNRTLINDYSDLRGGQNVKGIGFSVRLLRD